MAPRPCFHDNRAWSLIHLGGHSGGFPSGREGCLSQPWGFRGREDRRGIRNGADQTSQLLSPASPVQQLQGHGSDREYRPDRLAPAHAAQGHHRAYEAAGGLPVLRLGRLEGAVQAESRQDEERASLRHCRRLEEPELHHVSQDALLSREKDVREGEVPDRLRDRRHQRPGRAGSRTAGRPRAVQVRAGTGHALTSVSRRDTEGRRPPPLFFVFFGQGPPSLAGVAPNQARIQPMLRKLAVGALLAFLGGVLVAADVSDAVKGELARERKRLTSDSKTLADISRRLETALNQLASASRAVSEAAAKNDGADEIARREDAVSDSEQEVRGLLERRRLLADRVVERRRSITALEAEMQTRKPPDAVSGRWSVTLDPGAQRGVFRMTLEGTIVAGEYTLDGGYTGSLRGTLVNDRLRLERVDSRLGFSAIFYGRVARDASSIAGTWEATTLGTGATSAGIWKAVREEEREENP